MVKKSPGTQELEQAHREAARALAKTRKRIRGQADIDSFEYCILHEENVAEAKRAAGLIDKLLDQLTEDELTLVLLRERADDEQLLLAAVNVGGIDLVSNGNWEMGCHRFITWNDAHPPMLQTMQYKGPETIEFKSPLHRVLSGPGTFLAIGESDVAQRLLLIKKREGGPHDRFNFFYKLTRDLGYELTDKKLKARVEEERERVTHDCVRHVKSLEGVCEEMFFRGASAPYHNFKGDASSHLVSRAKGLAEQMRDTMSECRLYGVETDASREIAAFGKRWIKLFNLGNDDDT